ncbi:MAG: chitobiase/beta-hexosaminidase C-terminal domain-containing protein, partial [Deltaproteobacteria bacterium]|nr:chitobiase/beta-hexosaminidase C-terminal domain-containing protein [Deltaproteobacteria bacterium]
MAASTEIKATERKMLPAGPGWLKKHCLLALATLLFLGACHEQLLDEMDPPVTTASIETGLHSPQTVKLECDDGDGSGCLFTYYTTDGTTPSRASLPYTGPIAIWSETTIKFFSIDRAGNMERVNTEHYHVASVVLVDVDDFSAGWDHTLAIKTDGTLWAWGGNESGQLGNGGADDQPNPVQVGSDTDWLSVKAGRSFTLALKKDGSLWTWGNNDRGQLGNGNTSNSPAPAQVGSSTDWAVISAGTSHALAIKTDGTLWAWGANESGQLGNATLTDSSAPEQVGSGTSWKDAGAGQSHSIALRNDGVIWSWGSNTFGQLGDGSTDDRSSPMEMTGTNWASISTGANHNVALKGDGTLWAWGQNWYGQLGNGTTITKAWSADGSRPIRGFITFDRVYAIQIGTYTDWVSISAGGGHTLGIKQDGRLWTWGLNVNGQLGDGTNMNNLLPLPVAPESQYPNRLPRYSWQKISAGAHHSLGLRENGTLWSFGWNGSGQLGNGSTESTDGGSDPDLPTWKVPRYSYVISDAVYGYSLDYYNGDLTSIGAPYPAGDNPTSLDIHRSGNYLYVADSSTDGVSPSKIWSFTIDRTTGGLTPLGEPIETLVGVTRIMVEPLGRFVYVMGTHMKGWNVSTIAIYTVDPQTGELKAIGTQSY